MPADFIKSRLPCDMVRGIEKHSLLEFHTLVNERTGEASDTKVAKYKGLIFTKRLNRLWLSGSLHYFYNDGKHNHNDFNYQMLIVVLDEISELFNIDLTKCKLENLEIGPNIRLPFRTSFLLNNMLFHEVQKFKDEKVQKGNGDYKVVTHDRYMLKSYDKALQFSLPYELWRFEIHFSKMMDLKKLNITHLSDLRDLRKLENLSKELLKKFDEVFIYDWTINENGITRPPKDLQKMRLPHYWVDELNKNNRNKRKGIYNQIVKEHSCNVKALIRKEIEKKLQELLRFEKGDHFTIENMGIKRDHFTV